MKTTKKLSLRRETIRALKEENLQKIAAGFECTVTQEGCSASEFNLCQDH